MVSVPELVWMMMLVFFPVHNDSVSFFFDAWMIGSCQTWRMARGEKKRLRNNAQQKKVTHTTVLTRYGASGFFDGVAETTEERKKSGRTKKPFRRWTSRDTNSIEESPSGTPFTLTQY